MSNEKPEPFGYFKAEPFGWRDCAETDEGAIALYEAPQPQADALDTERLDWLIEQGCSHGVVYELDKSFWMVWLDGHDAHKDKHQIGRHHTAREAIDAAIAAAEAAHKQHAQPQADGRDAQRYRWLIDYFISDRVDLDDAIVAAKTSEDIAKIIDAAIAAAKEKTE